jgi:hypothetical protein
VISDLSLDRIDYLTGGRLGEFRVICPICGPSRSTAEKKRRKVLKIWRSKPDFASYACGHCGLGGYAADAAELTRVDPQKLARLKAEAAERERITAEERQQKALWFWRRRLPTSPVMERYLRNVRGFNGAIPTTLGFLPATETHPPAMIAAFGMARETAPGELTIDDSEVRGVHLTKLKADGSGKAGTENDKIMIGRSTGYPIIVAPVNDLLGLAIAEGIEDALSLHEATGLGAWAAGSANRLPALADRIPSYVEIVSIAADDDDVGLKYADELGRIVLRSRECQILVPR